MWDLRHWDVSVYVKILAAGFRKKSSLNECGQRKAEGPRDGVKIPKRLNGREPKSAIK